MCSVIRLRIAADNVASWRLRPSTFDEQLAQSLYPRGGTTKSGRQRYPPQFTKRDLLLHRNADNLDFLIAN